MPSAQARLAELVEWQPDADAIALAEANLAAAQANYEAAANKDAAAGNSLTSVRVTLEQAQAALADAQAAYAIAFDPARDWELTDTRQATALENERAAAERNLEKAEGALDIAQANYNLAVANLNNDSATSAQAAIVNAEQALARAQTGPTDAEITSAQLSVQQAQIGLAQAELALIQAQINLEAAQTALVNTTLLSPIDGIVVAVNAQPGESVSTAPFITIADLTQPLLEVFMDETDLDKVGLNYEVEVVFDALPDDLFIGHVVQVDPMLTMVDGVTAVRALVLLDADSFNKPQTLPVGMNAAAIVLDAQLKPAAPRLVHGLDPNLGVGARRMDGNIVEDRAQHLEQSLLVGFDAPVFGLDGQFHRVAVLAHVVADTVSRLIDDFRDIGFLDGELHQARFDLGQIQDDVDEPHQILGGVVDAIDVLAHPGVRDFRRFLMDQAAVADHGVEGRPQLVAHPGEEFGLVQADPVRRHDRCPQLVGCPAALANLVLQLDTGIEDAGIIDRHRRDVAQRGDGGDDAQNDQRDGRYVV